MGLKLQIRKKNKREVGNVYLGYAILGINALEWRTRC